VPRLLRVRFRTFVWFVSALRLVVTRYAFTGLYVVGSVGSAVYAGLCVACSVGLLFTRLITRWLLFLSRLRFHYLFCLVLRFCAFAVGLRFCHRSRSRRLHACVWFTVTDSSRLFLGSRCCGCCRFTDVFHCLVYCCLYVYCWFCWFVTGLLFGCPGYVTCRIWFVDAFACITLRLSLLPPVLAPGTLFTVYCYDMQRSASCACVCSLRCVLVTALRLFTGLLLTFSLFCTVCLLRLRVAGLFGLPFLCDLRFCWLPSTLVWLHHTLYTLPRFCVTVCFWLFTGSTFTCIAVAGCPVLVPRYCSWFCITVAFSFACSFCGLIRVRLICLFRFLFTVVYYPSFAVIAGSARLPSQFVSLPGYTALLHRWLRGFCVHRGCAVPAVYTLRYGSFAGSYVVPHTGLRSAVYVVITVRVCARLPSLRVLRHVVRGFVVLRMGSFPRDLPLFYRSLFFTPGSFLLPSCIVFYTFTFTLLFIWFDDCTVAGYRLFVAFGVCCCYCTFVAVHYVYVAVGFYADYHAFLDTRFTPRYRLRCLHRYRFCLPSVDRLRCVAVYLLLRLRSFAFRFGLHPLVVRY